MKVRFLAALCLVLENQMPLPFISEWLSSDGHVQPLLSSRLLNAEGGSGEKTKSRWDMSVVTAAFKQHHRSSSSARNQVCVARETSTKLPTMTEQREPFCVIDCSSFRHARDSGLRRNLTAIVPLAALRGDVFWSVSGSAHPANVLF